MNLFKTAAIALALAAATAATAQNGTDTPYSRFGYGMLRDNATAAQQNMGGIGLAMNSGRQINVMNPASYARTDSLTFLFDMGVDYSNQWRSEGSLSEHRQGGGLNYITMQFPLGKRLGMSIGILPYSAVGYAFGNAIDNGYANREGSGSINELYVGLGARLVHNLCIGFNFAYMFGSTAHDSYATVNDPGSLAPGSTSLYEKELRVRDWHLDLGLQYMWQLDGPGRVTFGFTYSPSKALLGTLRTYAYDTSADSNAKAVSECSTKSLYGLSETLAGGLAYTHGNRWMVEVDYTWQPWSKVKFDGITGSFADRYKWAAGGYWQPNYRGNYLQRIQYRLGANYTRDYIMVGSNHVREYGMGCGFGLPVPGFKSIVSLGFDWRHRQGHPQALISENYLNITLGINFNEMWFMKSRIY